MRFVHIIFTIALCGLLGCDEPPDAGTEGHGCHGWPGYGCDGDLTCINDTCVACGDSNEPCCDGNACNDGLACDSGLDFPGNCTNECGLPGSPCCPAGVCAPGAACNDSSICEVAAGDPCVSGSIAHLVVILDGSCNGTTVVLMTNSDAEAEACRQQLLDAAPKDTEICDLDAQPTTAEVCQDGWGPLYIPHCSDQQLAVCEFNLCINGCSYTDPVDGHCPNGP